MDINISDTLDPNSIYFLPLDEYDKRPVVNELSNEDEQKRYIEHRMHIIKQRANKARQFGLQELTDNDYKNAKKIDLTEEELDKNYYQESKWNKKAWLQNLIEKLNKDQIQYLPILKLRDSANEIINEIQKLKIDKISKEKQIHDLKTPKNAFDTLSIDQNQIQYQQQHLDNIIKKLKPYEGKEEILKKILYPTVEVLKQEIKMKTYSYRYYIILSVCMALLILLIVFNEVLNIDMNFINKIVLYTLLGSILIGCIYKSKIINKIKNKFKKE